MLGITIGLTLSSNAVSLRRDKSTLYARDVLSALVVCFYIGISSLFSEFYGKGLGLYHGLFHTTATGHIFHLFIFIICILIIQLNGFYPRKVWLPYLSNLFSILTSKLIYFNSFILNKTSEQFKILEYPLIILFVIIGGVFLISSCDLISVFLAIELQSYGLYILCSVYRNSEKATSAGLTYFLLGGLSSCFILLGSALLYSNSGNTFFDGFYIINNINNVSDSPNDSLLSTLDSVYFSSYMNLSFVVLSVGFLFKVSAAPFHFWSPDVYDAIPTVVTTFVATFAKISIFILLLEVVNNTSSLPVSNNQLHESPFNFSWTFTLLISSMLSLIIGSVLGLTQSRIKRLFAYSTISHVGFILLALTINSIESIQSFIFYLMQYSLSNLNAFIILLAMGYSLYLYVEKESAEKDNENKAVLDQKIHDKKNSPIQLISQIKGFFYINPALAISFAITIFSFVGIPPLVGFFAKQMVLSSALDSGYVFMALIAILTSVVSAYYYLALIKQMFFDKTDYIINPYVENISVKSKVFNVISKKHFDTNIHIHNISLSGFLSITISILTLTVLLFILNPQEWLRVASILALILFNT